MGNTIVGHDSSQAHHGCLGEVFSNDDFGLASQERVAVGVDRAGKHDERTVVGRHARDCTMYVGEQVSAGAPCECLFALHRLDVL